MQSYVVRILDVLRLMPDEIEQLHQLETKEFQGVDFDSRTKTYARVIPRYPRCCASWEIQDLFKKSPLKSHYHLGGAGIYAREQEAEKMDKISNVIEATFLRDAVVVYRVCSTCDWSETLWNALQSGGSIVAHDSLCKGQIREIPVKETEKAARAIWNHADVDATHALDWLVDRKRDELNMAIAIFTETKNKPKSRLDRIREEASKPLSD